MHSRRVVSHDDKETALRFLGNFDLARSTSHKIMESLGITNKDSLFKFCKIFAKENRINFTRTAQRRKDCMYKFLDDNLEKLQLMERLIVVEVRISPNEIPNYYGLYSEQVKHGQIPISESVYLGRNKEFDLLHGVIG